MKRIYLPLLAGFSLAFGAAVAPVNAQSRSGWVPTRVAADRMEQRVRFDVRNSLSRLDLNYGQRQKIRQLSREYERRLDRVRNDVASSPSDRSVRAYRTEQEWRSRTMHVLNHPEQRRLLAMERRQLGPLM